MNDKGIPLYRKAAFIRNLVRTIFSKCHRIILPYKAFPIRISIDNSSKLLGHIRMRGAAGTIVFGKRMTIYDATFVFSNNANSSLVFGDDVCLDERTIISPRKGSVIIGKNVFIGPHSIIQAYQGGDIRIGDSVMIAKGSCIFSSNHNISNPPFSYRKSEIGRPVTIADNVWVGSNVIINAGVQIGECAIIGSGSVVADNIDPYTINVGIPCRKIKYYSFENESWIDV